MIVASLVVEQAAGVYNQIRAGRINFASYFQQVHDALPMRVQRLLDGAGFDSFERAQARISQAVGSSASMLARALSIGANAAAFLLAFGVGLYVTFFLLRDGDRIGPAVVRALPLKPPVAAQIADKFVAVVRATIKGSGLVARVQGALGAVTFWIVGLPAALLWGMLMAIAALLPAIGPAIIWSPVAIYLLATGAIWQAVLVILSGVLAIGLVDNILRPIRWAAIPASGLAGAGHHAWRHRPGPAERHRRRAARRCAVHHRVADTDGAAHGWWDHKPLLSTKQSRSGYHVILYRSNRAANWRPYDLDGHCRL